MSGDRIFRPELYAQKIANLDKYCKRVEAYVHCKRPMTSNLDKQIKYKVDIVNSYNDLLSYICDFYQIVSADNVIDFEDRVKSSLKRVKENLVILGLEYIWSSDIYAQIQINNIVKLVQPTLREQNSATTASTSSLNSAQASITDDELGNSDTDKNDNEEIEISSLENNNRNINATDQIDVAIMPQTAAEFLKMAAPIMNYKFNGDPLKLESFIADVELVADLVEEQNTNVCFRFVKSKLEAKALECLPETTTTVEQIKIALRTHIKPETSTVIEGKLLALRLVKNDFSKFTEETEKLSESLRRSLVIEGISKAKAQEMTIKKTVEVCRKLARSEVVKSVLASSTFSEPSDVVAKFITESDVARKEHREAEVAKNKFGNNKNGHAKKFNKGGNFNRNNNAHPQNRSNNGGNTNGNPNFRNFRNNGRNQNNNNGNSQNNGRGFRNNNNRPGEHTIRIVTGDNPGPSNNGVQNGPSTSQEPFFHFGNQI